MSKMPDPNTRLRAAVRSEPVPPFLDARIRAGLRAADGPRRRVWRLVPVMAALGVFAALGISYQLGHLRLTVKSQNAYIATVSDSVATIMRAGLRDHIHCSVFRKYPKIAPTAEEFVQKMGPKYAGLIPIVQEHIPSEYHLVIAHQCGYGGRKFIHLSLMSGSSQMSLSITLKRPGESFDSAGMLPALRDAGIPMYQAGVQRFQVAAFETRDYLAYFVSDLSKEKNAEMMLAMAPEVKAYLNKLEL